MWKRVPHLYTQSFKSSDSAPLTTKSQSAAKGKNVALSSPGNIIAS